MSKNRKEKITDIYGNKKGNFFLCISLEDYKSKVETCGDISCGIPAILLALFDICEKTPAFKDKENIIKMLDVTWEERYGTKFDSN